MSAAKRPPEVVYRERLGRQVRAIRINAGLSVFELARAIGFNVTMIRSWETGRLWPSMRALFRIARAVRLPLEHLIP